MTRSKIVQVSFFLIVVSIALVIVAACGGAAQPQTITVVETVVVEKEVTVVETVEVEKEVVKEVIKEVVKEVEAVTECATKKDNYKIGFANLTEDIVFTQLVRQGIEKAAEEAGNIELVLADNKLDGATAMANADNFILQGVDGVIEFQTDEKFGNVMMQKFRDEGIPVIAIDIPMPGATFFGADNYRAGYMAGEAAAKWVKENWDGQIDAILSLELPQSGPIVAARLQGELEGLQDNLAKPVPDDMIFRLDSKNTQDESFKVVGDTLPKIPNAKRIVAIHINDGSALGTIAAFESVGREEQLIAVSQGADPSAQDEWVKEGSRFLGDTAYFPERYGEYLIPAIVDALECKVLPPAIYVDHVFISKDNLCEFYPDHSSCK
jgi:ribose transport system substrate-binding protein